MRRLFIDITELVDWEGKLTGVPRVMDEISKRYSSRDGVIFVSWSPAGYSALDYPITSGHIKVQSKHIKQAKHLLDKARSSSRLINKLHGRGSKIVSRALKKNQPELVQLKKNDTLFVMADWHGGDPSFIQYLIDHHEQGVKLVQIVYDMLPIVTPQYSGHSTEMLKNYSTKIYPICDLIFAISENTKKDIVWWLKKDDLVVPPIIVFRLGDDFSTAKAQKPEFDIGKRFILCVGTIEARKNHTLLYYAYKLAKQRDISLPPLVIVGRVGWLSHDTYEIMKTDPHVNQSFKFLHAISDNELAWLYNNCMFSIYPSFYEGWGLPIAESIAHGAPVLASNTSSMPEVAGNLIEYFSPASTEECLAAMQKMLRPESLKAAKGRIGNYKPVSWDETFNFVNERIGELYEQS